MKRFCLLASLLPWLGLLAECPVFAADPQTGLVMGLSHFRHPMNNLPYKVKALDGTEFEQTIKTMPFAPFDLPAAHIFKVGPDGQIHEIEAMGFQAPYNSPTGWE